MDRLNITPILRLISFDKLIAIAEKWKWCAFDDRLLAVLVKPDLYSNGRKKKKLHVYGISILIIPSQHFNWNYKYM